MPTAPERPAVLPLLQGFLAPAAELLVAAATPPASPPTLVVGYGSTLTLALLRERHPAGDYVLVEGLPPPFLKGLPPGHKATHGRSFPLPVRLPSLGGALHGLSFGDEGSDGGLIKESTRMLQSGAAFVGAFLLRGSFDAFFATARQVLQAGAPPGVTAGLAAAESQLRIPDELEQLGSRAGLAEISFAVEERGIPFGSPRAFLEDPAVRWILLRGIPAGPSRDEAVGRVGAGLVERLGDQPLVARVVTVVMRGVRQ
jgi:hypothetical protein